MLMMHRNMHDPLFTSFEFLSMMVIIVAVVVLTLLLALWFLSTKRLVLHLLHIGKLLNFVLLQKNW